MIDPRIAVSIGHPDTPTFQRAIWHEAEQKVTFEGAWAEIPDMPAITRPVVGSIFVWVMDHGGKVTLPGLPGEPK